MRAVLAGTGGRGPVALGLGAVIVMMVAQPLVDHGSARFAFWPLLGLITCGTLIAMVRRLHAMGRSGGWVVLSALPVIGIGLILWMMVGARGGENRTVTQRYWVGLALILCAGLLIASRAVWRPYSVASSSALTPAVQPGDWVIARRSPDIRRGAVLVFRHPARGEDGMSRLIGLPGDRVQMRGGQVFLNGQAVVQEATASFVVPAAQLAAYPGCGGADGAPVCEISQRVETLPEGPRYPVLDLGQTALDETAEFEVPAGQYFFLGDNRDNALDSRAGAGTGGLGFVPRDAIRGEAVRIAFNAALRDRFWRPVQ